MAEPLRSCPSETEFFVSIKGMDIQITFHTVLQSNATELVVNQEGQKNLASGWKRISSRRKSAKKQRSIRKFLIATSAAMNWRPISY